VHFSAPLCLPFAIQQKTTMSKSALSAALASPSQQQAPARPSGKQDENSFPCLSKGQGGPSDPTEQGDFSEAAAMRRSSDIAGSAPTAILSSSGAPYVRSFVFSKPTAQSTLVLPPSPHMTISCNGETSLAALHSLYDVLLKRSITLPASACMCAQPEKWHTCDLGF